MPSMTKNATVSQAVLWTGCLISLVGLYWDSTKTVYSIGTSLFWFGMIQSIFGSVFEVNGSKRTFYFGLGVLFSIASSYVIYVTLRDHFQSIPWTVSVVFTAIFVQVVISKLSMKIWDLRHRSGVAT